MGRELYEKEAIREAELRWPTGRLLFEHLDLAMPLMRYHRRT